MASRNKVVEYQLRLKDMASKALKKFGGTVKSTTAKADAAFTKLRGSVGKLGTKMKLAFAATVFLGLRSGMRRLREFSKAMGEVRTIMDETQISFKEAEGRVQELANSLGEASPDVAAGLYQTLSAGVTESAQAFMLLEGATKLGIAGVASTKEAVDLLTTTFNAYGKAVTEEGVEKMSDMIFKTIQLGKTTMPELSASMGQVLPMASQLGVSFEEAAAAVATLTLSGLSTSEAVTQVTAVMTAFLKKGALARKEFPELGNVMGASAIKSKGFMQAMKDLSEATGGSEEMLVKLTGRVEGAKAVMLLTGAGEQKFAEALKQIGEASGDAEKALENMMDTVDRKMKILEQAWSESWAAMLREMMGFAENMPVELIQQRADQITSIGGGIGYAIGLVFSGAEVLIRGSIMDLERYSEGLESIAERGKLVMKGVGGEEAALLTRQLYNRELTVTAARLKGISADMLESHKETLQAQVSWTLMMQAGHFQAGGTQEGWDQSQMKMDLDLLLSRIEEIDRVAGKTISELKVRLLWDKDAEAKIHEDVSRLGGLARDVLSRKEGGWVEWVLGAGGKSDADFAQILSDVSLFESELAGLEASITEGSGVPLYGSAAEFKEELDNILGPLREHLDKRQSMIDGALQAEIEEAEYQARVLKEIEEGSVYVTERILAGKKNSDAFKLRVKEMKHQIGIIEMSWDEGYAKEAKLIEENSELAQESARLKQMSDLETFSTKLQQDRELLDGELVAQGQTKEARDQTLADELSRHQELYSAFLSLSDERLAAFIKARKEEASRELEIAKATRDEKLEGERTAAGEYFTIWVKMAGEVAKEMGNMFGDASRQVASNVEALIEGTVGFKAIAHLVEPTAAAELRQLETNLLRAYQEYEKFLMLGMDFEGDEATALQAIITYIEDVSIPAAKAAEEMERLGVSTEQLAGKTGVELVDALGSAGESLQFLASRDIQTASQALSNFKAQIEDAKATVARLGPDGLKVLSPDQATEALAMIQRVHDLEIATLEAADAAEKLEKDWEGVGVTTTMVRDAAMQGFKDWGAELPNLREAVSHLAFEFADGLHGAIMDFVSGAKTAKEAWKDFSKAFLLEIASMIIKQMLFNVLLAIGKMLGYGLAKGGVVQGGMGELTALASGGVVAGGLGRAVPVKGYASGGPIVSSPHVALVGEGAMSEAVVPLPDGKSIPVQMEGGGATSVNISIQAVDAKGIDELLFSKQDLLAALMQRSLREDRAFRGAFKGR